MAWTVYQLSLSILMVVTGSINTLSTKWADDTEAVGQDGDKARNFDHPFFQASCMFLGEVICLLIFKAFYHYYRSKGEGLEDVKGLTKGNREFNPLILFIPAMCDMTATSLMYTGLNLTYASNFQMFRGSIIVFVGLFSMFLFKRKLELREWSGIFLVIIGLAIVGLSDFLSEQGEPSRSVNNVLIGDSLIIVAQIIAAIQMVVEEKFVSGQDIPPLQAVGWEGIFGFSVLALLQVIFYFVIVGSPFTRNPSGRLEDALDAFVQISNNFNLVISILGTIVSIAFFNFAGVSVTKELSATTRMVLDSVRTLVIWIVSLLFLHEKFDWIQLIGFIVLLVGMCFYNNIISVKKLRTCF